DEYRNLTLKTMFMLQWFNVFCDAHYLLKIDDDVALSADKLEGVLRKHASVSLGIIGRVNRLSKPIRDVRNKYYISHLQWPASKKVLPPFTAGPSYLVTRNASKLLYQRAMQ
ncbi:Beta-1,3-galactosyltransferase brn, partial [Gryllus bimaculatus]